MSLFIHPHKVQFYETDLMGIVHHSNYLRVFEEARVEWALARGILDYQQPQTASHLAVLETQVFHLKPCFFGDELEVQVQACKRGIRIVFEYKMFCYKRFSTPVSECRTVHVSLDRELRPLRLADQMKAILEKEKWTETWLSN